MLNISLPPMAENREIPDLPDARQISIIGGSGAGKTKFMEKLIELTGDKAYCLSAIKAPFPERRDKSREGSIDRIFKKYAERRPSLKINAESELEKLGYMLFADEFESLLRLKGKEKGREKIEIEETKIDKLSKIWRKIYPGNRIVTESGSLMFATTAGSDLISADKLSQGEMAVLYYVAAVLYAEKNSVIFIDAPSLFLHPTVLNSLWNEIESLRPDCIFVYNSVDVEFVSSRTRNLILWIKSFDASKSEWDYEILKPGEISEDIFIELVGSRKPVLFIEGDLSHSIDAKLYPLVFPEYTIKPMGSCDKVIETTRSFNGLTNMHHLESHGIVDRDRRTEREVEYLRKKSIMVPEVAEVENLFLIEPVVKTMAVLRGKNPETVFRQVKRKSMTLFKSRVPAQVLEHIRHRIKREVDAKIDAKFSCITALETHLCGLINLLNPRKQYNMLMHEFNQILAADDYASMLKVFNHKPLLAESGVADILGYKNRDEYIRGVINILKSSSRESKYMRQSLRRCFINTEPVSNVEINSSPNMPGREPRHRRLKRPGPVRSRN